MTMTTTTTDYERAVAMLNGRQHKKVAKYLMARLATNTARRIPGGGGWGGVG